MESEFWNRNLTEKINTARKDSDIPADAEIATIVYAGATLFYDIKGMNAGQIDELLAWIVKDIQDGTNFSRSVIYRKNNFFVIY